MKNLIDLVPSEGCTNIVQFLYRLYKRPLLAIPQNTHITLYQPDGTTEINPSDSIMSLINVGMNGDAPLVVKTLFFAPNTVSISFESPLI